MPLDYEETEKLHEELNTLFDVRIKDRVEESVQRLLPLVDQMIESHVQSRMRSPTSWCDPAVGGELSKWIEQQAKSAADHHIRLFGGCAALNKIIQDMWDAKKEQYIRDEVDRRLRDIMKKIGAVTTTA